MFNDFHRALWCEDVAWVLALLELATTRGDVEALLHSEVPAPHGRARRPLMVAADVGSVALSELLLARGCSVDQANSLGVTALFVAAQEGRDDVVLLLLRRGASTTLARHFDSATPMLLAAQHGQVGAVRLLVAAGDDVCAATSDTRVFPLWSACLKQHADVVVALVAAGADVQQRAGEHCCLYCVAYADAPALGQLLVALGARLPPADRARPLPRGNAAFWQHLFERGAAALPPGAAERAAAALEAERDALRCAARRLHWPRLRANLARAAVGLQDLALPALVTQTIFEQSDERADAIPMFLSWEVITKVKHWHERRRDVAQ
jgi:hypothetical protein